MLGSKDFLNTIVVLEALEAFFLAQDIDVSLREHGAKPGGKFAPAMKMMEQRHAAEAGFPAIECCVQRIGKFAGVGIIPGASRDGGGSGVKILTIGREKMLPGGFASGRTGGG